jgi:hypothetical protein
MRDAAAAVAVWNAKAMLMLFDKKRVKYSRLQFSADAC